MISIYEGKRSTKSNELYKLLSQTSTQTIENSLFIKSISQKEKEIKMETKKRKKFLINN